jgi:hypothetical protein
MLREVRGRSGITGRAHRRGPQRQEVVMFCPQCGGEYRSGFNTCADCGVALVTQLPADWQAEEGEDGPLAPIDVTHSPERLAELTSRLEAAEVPYVVQAGTALALLDDEEAMLPHAPGTWEARLWVAADRRQEAKTILADVHMELGQEQQRPVL